MRFQAVAAVVFAMSCGHTSVGAPEDPCGDEASAEIATICRSNEARRLAEAGEPREAGRMCNDIEEGVWRDECHFLVGEALVGKPIRDALAACDRSGRFRGNCTAHVLWSQAARTIGVVPSDAGAQRAVDEWVALSRPGTRKAPGRPTFGDPDRHIRARAWFDVYYGSGSADTTALRGATEADGPQARTAFAWEAVRLLGTDGGAARVVPRVAAVFRGEEPPPGGSVFEPKCWRGWRAPAWRPSLIGERPVTDAVGGDLRLVADDPDTDLLIASLEAFWSHARGIHASEFGPWLDDPREVVRWTAVRLAASAAAVEADPPPQPEDEVGIAIARAVAEDIQRGWRFDARTTTGPDPCASAPEHP